jgi:myo-inositol-1(or 4)-monophosphatase
MNIDNCYKFIVKIITQAGQLALVEREKSLKIMTKNKDYKDIVTNVDRKVNKFLVNQIKKNFSHVSIYSEEQADGQVLAQEYQWVIDPIDGTANFSRHIPHFAVCLGLLKNGQPEAGAVYNPVTKELFSFQKDKGAFLNFKPIRVSGAKDLSQAHIFFHAGRKKELNKWGGESYRRLLAKAKKTNNLASSSLDTCFVAAGRIEANIYGTLSTLDIASAIGILLEAGGVIADKNGQTPAFLSNPQKIYMANNQQMLDQILELLEN